MYVHNERQKALLHFKKRETPESPFSVIDKQGFGDGLRVAEHTFSLDRTLYFPRKLSHNRGYLSATADQKAHTLEWEYVIAEPVLTKALPPPGRPLRCHVSWYDIDFYNRCLSTQRCLWPKQKPHKRSINCNYFLYPWDMLRTRPSLEQPWGAELIQNRALQWLLIDNDGTFYE